MDGLYSGQRLLKQRLVRVSGSYVDDDAANADGYTVTDL